MEHTGLSILFIISLLCVVFSLLTAPKQEITANDIVKLFVQDFKNRFK
jgi:hypothetical protein